MSPSLVSLALRAIAHGAPELRYEPGGMGHTLPGEVEVGGLVYERVVVDGVPRLLPLLSHWSWLGWILDEVSRRGYAYAIEAVDGGMYRVNAWHSSWVCERYSLHMGREEALVTLLEATHTKSAP